MNFINQLQSDIEGQLEATPFFNDIPVLSQAKGVTESIIEQKLGSIAGKAGKKGACVVVLMPTFVVDSPDLPGPTGSVIATVRVFERPLFSRDKSGGVQKTAEEIAFETLQALHHWESGAALLSADRHAIAPSEDTTPGVVAYDVNLLSGQTGKAIPAKCARPEAVVTGSGPSATVSFICQTEGSSIFYSLDGSYPNTSYASGPHGPMAFTLTGDYTIRARASAPGQRLSDITEITTA